MKFIRRSALEAVALAIASASLIPSNAEAQFASTVITYNAGTGASPTHNDAASALGGPSRVNPFGDAVEPFNPPYHPTQLVSIGTGGSITVGFPQPVSNHAGNPFGIDFLVFGGSGFMITNAFDESFNWIGTPATDGSLFGGGDALTRVSVSPDGNTFYSLEPSRAPVIEGLFPTDASGNTAQPVDPSFRLSDFAGLTLDGIRQRYAGGAGGTGFDVAWARNTSGQPVALDAIQFVRVEVLNGKIELDGFGAIHTIPEPNSWMLVLAGGAAGLLWFRRHSHS
jgi:hypothetical protein